MASGMRENLAGRTVDNKKVEFLTESSGGEIRFHPSKGLSKRMRPRIREAESNWKGRFSSRRKESR